MTPRRFSLRLAVLSGLLVLAGACINRSSAAPMPATGVVNMPARDVGPSAKFLSTDLGPDRIALSTAVNHAHLFYDADGDLSAESIPAPGRAAAWSLTLP